MKAKESKAHQQNESLFVSQDNATQQEAIISEAQAAISKMVNQQRFFQEIGKNHKEIRKHFDSNRELEDNIKRNLNEFLVKFEEKMKILPSINSQLFDQNIVILRNLISLDTYFFQGCQNNFKKLYNEYLSMQTASYDQCQRDAKEELDQGNYEGFKRIFEEEFNKQELQKAKGDFNSSDNSFAKISVELTKKIKYISTSIKKKILNIDPKSNKQIIEDVDEEIREVINILKFIDQKIMGKSNWESLTQILQNFYMCLINNSEKIINQSKKNLQGKQIKQSYFIVKNTINFMKNIDSLKIDKDSNESIAQLQMKAFKNYQDLKSQLETIKLYIKNLEGQYKNYQHEDYQQQRTRGILEDINELAKEDEDILYYYQDIQKAISNWCKEQLKQVQSKVNANLGSQDDFTKIEQINLTLIQIGLTSIIEDFNHQIEQLQTKLKHQIQQRFKDFENMINGKDMSIVNIDILALTNFLQLNSLDQKQKDKVNKICSDLVTLTEQRLKSHDLKNVLENFLPKIQIIQDHEKLYHLNQNQNQKIDEIQDQVAIIFMDMISEIIQYIHLMGGQGQNQKKNQVVSILLQKEKINSTFKFYLRFRTSKQFSLKKIPQFQFDNKINQVVDLAINKFEEIKNKFVESIEFESLVQTVKIMNNVKEFSFVTEFFNDKFFELNNTKMDENSLTKLITTLKYLEDSNLYYKAFNIFENLVQYITNNIKGMDGKQPLDYQKIQDQFNILETFIHLENKLSEHKIEDPKITLSQLRNQFMQNIAKFMDSMNLIMHKFLNGDSTSSQTLEFTQNLQQLKDIKEKINFSEAAKFSKIYDDIIKKIETSMQHQYKEAIGMLKKIGGNKKNKINVQGLVGYLTVLQNIKIIDNFKQNCEQHVDDIIMNVKEQEDNHPYLISDLQFELQKTDQGRIILSESKVFKGIANKRKNLILNRVDYKKLLEWTREDLTKQNKKNQKENDSPVQIDELTKYYEKYLKKLNEILKENLKDKSKNFENIRNVRSTLQKKVKDYNEKLSMTDKGDLPELLALLISLYAIHNSEAFFQANGPKDFNNNQDLLEKLHAGQVIAIFRIFGIGYNKLKKDQAPIDEIRKSQIKYKFNPDQFFNNMVEIQNAEGKSVVIAVAAIIFALWGFEVTCIQQNEYLCQYECDQYSQFFSLLGVEQFIKYKTLEQACKETIDSSFGCSNNDESLQTISEAYFSKIFNPEIQRINSSNHHPDQQKYQSKMAKVMLIENIESLCSEQFQEQEYEPELIIQNQEIINYFEELWKNKNDFIRRSGVIGTVTGFFGQMASLFKDKSVQKYFENLFNPNFKELHDKTVQKIIEDLKEYNNPPFQFYNGRVYYQDENKQFNSIKKSYGYKTIFAYQHALQENHASQRYANSQIGITFKFGKFLLSKIPSQFSLLIGVSSNISRLNLNQRKILSEKYRIVNYTQIPSILRDVESTRKLSSLDWKSNPERIFIAQNLDKQIKYLYELIKILSKKRGIIIIFKDKNSLYLFNSFNLQKIRFNILTNQMIIQEQKTVIHQAGIQGNVTLATKEMIIGTDFQCQENIAQSEGIHLIQTFLSETKTEYLNIKGRTAHMNHKGSYQMILNCEDLVNDFNFNSEHGQQYGNIHVYLKALRDSNIQVYQEEEKMDLTLSEAERMKEIVFSKQQTRAQKKADEDILKFLISQNFSELNDSDVKGRAPKSVNTIIMIEATKQMEEHDLISKMKSIIEKVISNTEKEIKAEYKNNQPGISFQIVIYRNYNEKKNKIIEISQWCKKPEKLKKFLNQQKNELGFNHEFEAVELGLYHAIQEYGRLQADGKQLSQIILIGKSQPNVQWIKQFIKKNENLMVTPIQQPVPYYEDLIKHEVFKKVPLHCFYLHKQARDTFSKMASHSYKGTSEFIDPKHLLSEYILQNILLLTLCRAAELNMEANQAKEYNSKIYARYNF